MWPGGMNRCTSGRRLERHQAHQNGAAGASMSDLNLTLACGPFDRTQALRDGSVKPEGINLTYLTLEPAEIFYRMINYREFDLSEMSITNYITLVSLGESPFVAIPVFPSRVFRHGYFFINTG